jgi:hypothetical protein
MPERRAAVETIAVKRCVFQHPLSRKYKWLSFETEKGGNDRYLFESTETTDEPKKKTDVEGKRGSLVDYEHEKQRIEDKGYLVHWEA